MTDRRKSVRELEHELADLDGGAPRDGTGGWEREQRAEARERWGADDYERGSLDRIRDAYLLTDGYDWGDAFLVTWKWAARIRHRFGLHAPDVDLPEFPTEDVVGAWLTFGDEVGIDGHGLRDRHGEDWPRWFFEALYFEMERARMKRLDPDGSRKAWELNKDTVEDNIREWRAEYEAVHGDGR